MNPKLIGILKQLIVLGADEFYLGYVNRLKDSLSIISLRPTPRSNFSSVEEAEAAIDQIKKRDRKVFVTLNGMFYPGNYFDTLIADIAEMSSVGCDGFIVSDINLFLRIKKEIPGLYIIASSGAHAMNSRVVKFLRDMGVRRCILPRQLTPDEIKDMVSTCPDMDFEIFMKNEECAFLDGYCFYSHYGEIDDHPACNELFRSDSELAPGRMLKLRSCGACVLFKIGDIENLSLKICGRALGYDPIMEDVAFLNQVISGLGATESEAEFERFCRKSHDEVYGVPCSEICYYPQFPHGADIESGSGKDSQRILQFPDSGGNPRTPSLKPDYPATLEQKPEMAGLASLMMSKRLDTMEKALSISDPGDLKYFSSDVFTRIYFGNEYCEYLLPSVSQMEYVAAFAKREKAGLTFATPSCLDRTFVTIEKLLETLPEDAEVVFNDWGLLKSIERFGLRPVHGRLLCTVRKDTRITAAPSGNSFHKTHNIQPFYQEFLIENNVFRVELDNVPQGYDLALDSKLSASLYYPYITCAVSRKCAFANMAAEKAKFEVVSRCAGFCGGRILNLELGGRTVFVQGNAQFFINPVIPGSLHKWNVDRIVYMPVIPNHNKADR